MSADPDKREEDRLLRAMQKKTPKPSVFAKTSSTDLKKQKEEEDKKRKQKEDEEKAKKLKEEAEKKKKLAELEEQRRRDAEEQQRRREAEEREQAEKASATFAERQAAFNTIDPATEKVLSKEEHRLRRVVSGKEPAAAKPKESGLQAHLRLLQEKQQKIEEHKDEPDTTTHAHPSVISYPPQPQVEQQHHQEQHHYHQHPQAVEHHEVHSEPPHTHSSAPTQPTHEHSDFPQPGPPSMCGPFELEILAQLNEVRVNPVAYANYLKTLESNYDGTVFAVPGSRYVRQTKEGVSALHYAIEFLNTQQPVPELQISELLSRVSRDLVEEEGKGVQQSAQSAAFDRFSKYGRWEGEMAEMISYGGVSAKEVVLQWLVDDGDHERRDQRSIVQPHFRIVGLSSGHHPEYGRICVATLTHEYNDLKDPPKENTNAAANVSLIKEEDGRVVINGGSAPGSKAHYKLLKRGKRLTLLSADVNRSWDLPFDFQAAGVRATIDGQSNLTIEIAKANESVEDNGAVLISSFNLDALSGAGPKIQLAVRQDPEFIYVDINPSHFEEEVSVKTKGNAVEVESKHTEIEEANDQTFKKAITSVQTLQLPFKPTEIVVEHKVTGKPCVVINKKIASTPRSVHEEEIPIF